VFERFTERARQVVVLAQDEARALRHNYIGTEHILLGLLREEEGIAAAALDSLDVTVEDVRAQVKQVVGQGDELVAGQIPFTPRAKKLLELSLREALTVGDNYIGTEHVLLGLARENEGVAAQILRGLDADAEKIRNAVLEARAGQPPPKARHRPRRAKGVVEELTAELRPLAAGIESLRRRVVLASALAAVAFPAGLLVGWLIWG
jgi:ATP-dependent Clp protease ATP-binding subunit ClpC